MCCVAMVVDTTVESRGSVLADSTHEEGSSTWVLVDERRDVVDEAADTDKRSGLGLFLELFPRYDGEIAGWLGVL